MKGEIDTFQLKMFLNVWDISFHGSGQKTQLILNDGNHTTICMCTMSSVGGGPPVINTSHEEETVNNVVCNIMMVDVDDLMLLTTFSLMGGGD